MSLKSDGSERGISTAYKKQTLVEIQILGSAS